MIVPKWPTQSWFPMFLNMLTNDPLALKRSPDILTMPVSGLIHPLHNKLDLLVCRLSGYPSRVQVPTKSIKILMSSWREST